MVSALDSGSKGPGIRALAGVIVLCLEQDTLLSSFLSPPRCINGYRRNNAGDNPEMDQHPIQGGGGGGGKIYSKPLNATEVGISPGKYDQVWATLYGVSHDRITAKGFGKTTDQCPKLTA